MALPPPPKFNMGQLFASGQALAASPFMLKKQKKPTLFETFDQNYKPTSTMKLMRYLDTLRYHIPTLEERERYNLTAATERIHLHWISDVGQSCINRILRFLMLR